MTWSKLNPLREGMLHPLVSLVKMLLLILVLVPRIILRFPFSHCFASALHDDGQSRTT